MSWSYVVRRLAQLVPSLFTILLVTFALIHLAPGDPAGVVAGEYADEETRARINEQFGLDKPMWSQFFTYVGNVATGDLGQSFVYGRSVAGLIGERLPATLLLASTALLLSVVGGIALGRLAASRPNGPVDAGVTGVSLLGYAFPGFWLGQIAILLFALRWDIFPALGMQDDRAGYTGLDHILDVGWHLTLPAFVLAASEIALVTRLTRTGLVQQMGEGYARTAAGKGLRRRDVLARHTFPNAALPLITVIGTRIGFLFSGAVVIETVFSWPGVGLLLTSAVETGDRPMAMGLVLMISAAVLVANVVTDLVYAWIDPRIRYD